jgi:palmitoyl-protein thioesterase
LQCRLAARAARSGIYSSWAQDHLVSAQYYRDVERLDEYAQTNTFLMRLNNETLAEQRGAASRPYRLEFDEVGMPIRSGTGRVDGLENLVAVMFDADRESFGPLGYVPSKPTSPR